MKKRDYEKPSMKVVKMQQRQHLMTGSNGGGTVNDYNWNNYEEE